MHDENGQVKVLAVSLVSEPVLNDLVHMNEKAFVAQMHDQTCSSTYGTAKALTCPLCESRSGCGIRLLVAVATRQKESPKNVRLVLTYQLCGTVAGLVTLWLVVLIQIVGTC